MLYNYVKYNKDKLYFAIKNFAYVIITLFLSYIIWEIIGLNVWAKSLRQGELYFLYQSLFMLFLAAFFFGYLLLFYKKDIQKGWRLSIYGVGAGYLSSYLSFCFWPLLAPHGLNKFLNMQWDILDIFYSSAIIGGWLNGFIMSSVLSVVIKLKTCGGKCPP